MDSRKQMSQASPQASRQGYIDEARRLLDAGDHVGVCRTLDRAIAHWPQDPQLHYWRGNALRLLGDVAAAAAAFRAVLRHDPASTEAALALAHTLRDAGQIGSAGRELLQYRQQRPAADPAFDMQCAEFLFGCRLFAELDTLCDEALGQGRAVAGLSFHGAQAALILGNFDKARTRLLQALDQGLDLEEWGGAWLLLASLQKFTDADHDDIERFRRALGDPQTSPMTQAAACFALGKAMDDLGNWSAAAEHFRSGNRLVHTQTRWEPRAWALHAQQQQRAGVRLRAVPFRGTETFRPVFVVGMPRSGTTLLARLLSRHFPLRNRGERAWIPYLVQQTGWGSRGLADEALATAATIYARQLRQDDAPSAGYIDKNPMNYRHLGFIASLFPQARVIHCVRSERDIALSVWTQFFGHFDTDFAYDFDDIRFVIEHKRDVMAHWQAQLPAGMLCSVRYEDLVQRPEALMAKMEAFLGLGQKDRPVEQHDAVATASVWQARQPVYASSIARWRAYAPFVPELMTFDDQGREPQTTIKPGN